MFRFLKDYIVHMVLPSIVLQLNLFSLLIKLRLFEYSEKISFLFIILFTFTLEEDTFKAVSEPTNR